MGLPDFDAPLAAGQSTIAPASLAHVVLRTADLPRLQAFYTAFLGGKVVFAGGPLSFIAYDNEHHRIALIAMPGTATKDPKTCGLEHIAFAFGSLADLLLAYRQRKEQGILPCWSVNHGPTTSIYYRDPDGNMLETQTDNFASADEATAFMMGPHFAENPIGTEVDPEALIAALRAGQTEAELKVRQEIGPRMVPDIDVM
jgi:catechol-2,3-dioxygenase